MEQKNLPPAESAFYNEDDEEIFFWSMDTNRYASPSYLQVMYQIYPTLYVQYICLVKLDYTSIPRASNMLLIKNLNTYCTNLYYEIPIHYMTDDINAKYDIYNRCIAFLRKLAIHKFMYQLKVDINNFVEEEEEKENLYKNCNDLREQFVLFFCDFLLDDNTKVNKEFIDLIFSSCYDVLANFIDKLKPMSASLKKLIANLNKNNKILLGYVELVKFQLDVGIGTQLGLIDHGTFIIGWFCNYSGHMDEFYLNK